MSEDQAEVQVNPQRRGIKRGIYIIPSAFTIGNILCGFYAVINAMKGYQSLSVTPDHSIQLFDNAARAIGFAVLLDSLDGNIARMTKTTSEFGVELDSIADVLSFGIAPAVLAYTWGYGSTHGLERFAWGVSFFFLICGALRLARFNVMARAPRFSQGSNTPKFDKRFFVGLPIPAAAGMLAAVIHFAPTPLPLYDATRIETYSWILLAGMATLAILMVSTVRYASFKNVSLRSNKPFITLPLLSVVVAGVWFYSQWLLLGIVSLFIIHGPLLKLWGLINRLRRPLAKAEDSSAPPIEN